MDELSTFDQPLKYPLLLYWSLNKYLEKIVFYLENTWTKVFKTCTNPATIIKYKKGPVDFYKYGPLKTYLPGWKCNNAKPYEYRMSIDRRFQFANLTLVITYYATSIKIAQTSCKNFTASSVKV